MAAAIWRRCSSTSLAAPAKRGRPRDDGAIAGARCVLAAPSRRNGAPPLVSAQLILAAGARPDLLAGGADADVGLSATVRVAELRFLHEGGRYIHRRGDAVGYPVPRPARILDFFPRRNVCPQPRQPDDEPAAPGGVRGGADDPERRPAFGRHGAGVAAGNCVLRLQPVGAWSRARGVLLEPPADQLGDRDSGRGYSAASWTRRREHGVELHVPVSAADLRLLPSRGAARLASGGGLDAAADLCV